jgi:hypothetical protein
VVVLRYSLLQGGALRPAGCGVVVVLLPEDVIPSVPRLVIPTPSGARGRDLALLWPLPLLFGGAASALSAKAPKGVSGPLFLLTAAYRGSVVAGFSLRR